MPCSTAGPPGCPAGSRPHRAVQRAGLVAVGGAQVGRVDPAARADGHPRWGVSAVECAPASTTSGGGCRFGTATTAVATASSKPSKMTQNATGFNGLPDIVGSRERA